MTKEHLKLLDFILPILSEMYPDGNTLNSLAHDYKKITKKEHGYQDLRRLKDLYNDQYFTVYKDSNYIRITPETKEIIDNYGSLSNYLREKLNDQLSEDKINNELKNLQVENARLTNINLKLQNKHLRRYILYAIIGFVVGVISTNWKDILELLK